MTTEKAGKYLKLCARLDKAEELLETLQNASNPRTQAFDVNAIHGKSRPSNPSDATGNFVIETESLKERIAKLKRETSREKKKLLAYADAVDHELFSIVFRMKYIRGLMWTEIADIFIDNSEEYLKKGLYRLFEKSEAEARKGAKEE